MLAIVVSTVAGFAISATYYSVAPATAAHDGAAPEPSPVVVAMVELCRSAAVAVLIAVLMSAANWVTPTEGALLGAGLWTLPVVLLIGSVVHESTPWRSAAVHAGDWLVKLVALGAIIGWLN